MSKLRNRRGEEVLSIQYEGTSYRLCVKVVTRTAIYRVTRSGNYFISGKESGFDVMIDSVMVIYHKGCADGVAAAWCFSHAYDYEAVERGGDLIYFHAGVYGDAPPDVTGMRVFLVDFSYHPDVVKEMCKTAKSVTLLDHHISAIEALSIPMPSNFDMSACTINKAGCEIAWEFLFKDKPMPALLQHIADRDLWKFNFHKTKAVTTALFVEPITIANIDKHINDVDSLARDGVLLLKQHQSNVERLIKAATRRQWIGGYHVISINAPWFYASDIGDAFKDTEPFSATYHDTEEWRIYSLRSGKNGLDVSKIAAAYGGGGHRHAAGFKVSRNHILSRT